MSVDSQSTRERQNMLEQALKYLKRAIELLPDDRYRIDTYNKCAKAYNRGYWKQWSSRRMGYPLPLNVAKSYS